MSDKEFLEIDVATILLRHGRQAVIDELALQLNVTAPKIEHMIEIARERKRTAARAKPKEFKLDAKSLADPERGKLLELLKAKFDNKTFLPQLRDVKRYFEKNGMSARTLKSRDASQKALFSLLSKESPAALRRLTEDLSGEPFSSLGLISEEILKNKRL